MTTTLRNAIPVLLLGLSLAGAAHAAPVERDAVVVQLRTVAPEAPARIEPEAVPAADMTEHMGPGTIGAIAGAIGLAGIAGGIRRRRARRGMPEAV